MEGEPKNDLEMLQEAIARSSDTIEQSFANTENPWLSCVNDHLTTIMLYIDLSRMEGLITEEGARIYSERAQSVSDRVKELRKIYPEKLDEVPEEIKQEILSRLDVLA